jgi:hypothetical protein
MGHGDIFGRRPKATCPVRGGIHSASNSAFEIIEGFALGKVREPRFSPFREPNKRYVSLGSPRFCHAQLGSVYFALSIGRLGHPAQSVNPQSRRRLRRPPRSCPPSRALAGEAAGEIEKLKPEYRLALARDGYALVKCELTVFRSEA